MASNRYSAIEAIKLIELGRINGRRILGVDGFEESSRGYIARLDLIFDVSGDVWTVDRAYEKVISFVRNHIEDHVTFEIVFD